MADDPENTAKTRAHVSERRDTISDGAQFWVHISPQHGTEQYIQQWEVRFQSSDWTGSITSDNPQEILQTPGLSGVFEVIVIASGPTLPRTHLTPLPDSKPQIGCNGNCAAMVGIIAGADGGEAHYWTVWDALCN
jgi:hypothetical protein